jgi:transposase InsO family protein
MILQSLLLSRLSKNYRTLSGRVRVNRSGIHRLQILRHGFKKKDAYTLHTAVRKRFPGNPYTVTNINDVWECDLVGVQGLRKYNDGVKYLLTVTDVFSKFLHIIPLINKTGKTVTTAFQSILKETKYLKPIRKRPVWMHTDRGKEFLNR